MRRRMSTNVNICCLRRVAPVVRLARDRSHFGAWRRKRSDGRQAHAPPSAERQPMSTSTPRKRAPPMTRVYMPTWRISGPPRRSELINVDVCKRPFSHRTGQRTTPRRHRQMSTFGAAHADLTHAVQEHATGTASQPSLPHHRKHRVNTATAPAPPHKGERRIDATAVYPRPWPPAPGVGASGGASAGLPGYAALCSRKQPRPRPRESWHARPRGGSGRATDRRRRAPVHARVRNPWSSRRFLLHLTVVADTAYHDRREMPRTVPDSVAAWLASPLCRIRRHHRDAYGRSPRHVRY